MVAPPATKSAHPASRPASQAASVPAARPGLYVQAKVYAASVHGEAACVDCHPAAKTLPHAPKLGQVNCTQACHSKAKGDFLQGVHAAAAARGDPGAPTCVTCHGGHDILPKNNRNSRTYPLNVISMCGNCHQKHTGNVNDGKQQMDNYMASGHGRALIKSGLIVSATCADCHGSHRVLPSKDPQSSVNRTNVAATCGHCHVGINEVYQTSVHGELLARGNAQAPVCSDCHTAHNISRTNTPDFKLDIVNECGQCHDKPIAGSKHSSSLYETYRRSYHGQATALGLTRGARCSSCHGSHNIRRLKDPAGQLFGEKRLQTCRQCHPEATAKFAQFDAHADFRDAKNYPLLHAVWLYFMIMMSCAFGFFGLHSALWALRSFIDRLRNGRKEEAPNSVYAIQRFNRVDRINHAFVILSFFGLTLTGLPLLYSDQHWGKTLAGMLGGVRSAGLLHRGFALILIGNFVVHGVGILRRIRQHTFKGLVFGPATMLPRKKDVQDCLGMFRYFFRGGKMPQLDRWTYWEKFDYVAEVGGSGIIGATGLLLWFPEFSARFLPGWIFNVATVVHGYEALLAIGFIFTMHFFNAHLRLEKFPVDDVIFTGRLPEDVFKHERGAEYARLVETGQLEKLRVRPPRRWWRWLATLIGIVAMTIGLTLVALIILAGLKWI